MDASPHLNLASHDMIGALQATLTVPLMDTRAYETLEHFTVELSEPMGGASFAETLPAAPRVVVRIVGDDRRRRQVDLVAAALEDRVDAVRLPSGTWGEQFRTAAEYEGESLVDLFLYLLALPWKLVFAFVPPATYAGGWLCFFTALMGIGALTALIGDLAGQMGCAMGLLPSVTAITFVALGTSLPDTFASKTAAINEAHADSSIGNITGSNSVNVFLGLGLPWALAALYWSFGASPAALDAWHARYAREEWYYEGMAAGFAVPAGDLGFSVAVFSACAVGCLLLLVLRRATLGYELGGPDGPKYASAIFLGILWMGYIGLSSAAAYGYTW